MILNHFDLISWRLQMATKAKNKSKSNAKSDAGKAWAQKAKDTLKVTPKDGRKHVLPKLLKAAKKHGYAESTVFGWAYGKAKGFAYDKKGLQAAKNRAIRKMGKVGRSSNRGLKLFNKNAKADAKLGDLTFRRSGGLTNPRVKWLRAEHARRLDARRARLDAAANVREVEEIMGKPGGEKRKRASRKAAKKK